MSRPSVHMGPLFIHQLPEASRYRDMWCGDDSCLPDLTDPATQGWIAALVREAWGDPNIQGPAEPAALVRLLLSAPADAGEKLSAQLLSQREERND